MHFIYGSLESNYFPRFIEQQCYQISRKEKQTLHTRVDFCLYFSYRFYSNILNILIELQKSKQPRVCFRRIPTTRGELDVSKWTLTGETFLLCISNKNVFSLVSFDLADYLKSQRSDIRAKA